MTARREYPNVCDLIRQNTGSFELLKEMKGFFRLTMQSMDCDNRVPTYQILFFHVAK
uniref:Uncharacterized protein n=1 Tax=Arundo donax TaxID=35708 RepID=A0A0A9BTU1_ARUDO